MTGIYDSIVRKQLEDVVDGIHQLIIISSCKVAAADVIIIDCVARESDSLIFAIEKHRTGRMAGRVDNLKRVVAKGYHFAVGEVMLRHRNIIGIFLVNLGDADRQMLLHDPFIILMDLGQQTIALVDQVVTIQVVMMGMGEQQAHWAQVFLFNKTDKAFTFTEFIHAAVDDNGFSCLIPHDVSTLLKRVHHVFLYIDHIPIFFCATVGLRHKNTNFRSHATTINTIICFALCATCITFAGMKNLILIATVIMTAMMAQGADGDTLSLGEVTVTAIKQGSDLRNQAAAVSVIERKDAERNRVVSVRGGSDMVPNVFIPDYGSRMTSTIYVRGIGTRIDQPAVGLTIDNVPVMTKENYDFDLIDISHMEVLRGPQNTLYGRNTLGGVMNVYTLSPLNYQGTRATIEGASHGTWRVGASHYRLLGENLGMSLSAQYNSTQGEFTNLHNDKRCDWERLFSTRAKLEWLSASGWYAANVLSIVASRQGGYPYEWVETGRLAYNDTCFYRRTSITDGLTVRKSFDRFSLSSITSYQYIDDNMTLDQDFTEHDYFTLTQKRREHAVTQDLIARSHDQGQGYDWLVGASGFYRRYCMDAPVTFYDYGIEQLIENHINDVNPYYPIAWDTRSFVLGSHFTSPNWGAALYHESTYRWGQWTVQAGMRLEYEHACLNYHSETHTGYSIYNAATGALFAHEAVDIDENGTLDKDFFEILPNVSLTWHPWEGKKHTIYLAAARGSKAGGFNTQMFSDVLQQRLMGMMGIGQQYDVDQMVGYNPEKAWNYELGGHFECWQGRVQSDMDIFFMDCRDRQLTVFPPGTITGRMMTNAGKTHSLGAEFAMTVTPSELTRLSLSYGYTHAKFKDYNDGKNDYDGKRVPYAPSHTLFAEAAHSIRVNGDRAKLLSLAANVRAVGDIYWDEANTQQQPFYALLGASVTWQQPRYSVQLWGRNLTGTSYKTFYFVSIQHIFLQRGHGRQLGITLRLSLD